MNEYNGRNSMKQNVHNFCVRSESPVLGGEIPRVWLFKKPATVLLALVFCCTVANPALAALAPVESRSTSGATTSQPGASQPIFSGTNKIAAAPSTRSGNQSATNSGYPMTAEDRAAHLTFSQIENLQRELGELRGLVETQEHTIKQLKKSQQDLYLDLERRLNQLQNSGQKTTAAASISPTAVNAASKTAAKPTATGNKANPASSTAGTTGGSASAIGATQPAKPAAKPAAKTVSMTVSMKEDPAGSTTGSSASTSGSSKTTAAGIAAKVSAANVDTVNVVAEDVDLESNVIESSSAASINSSHASKGKLLGEQETYQNAYSFVRSKKYTEAVAGLQDYLRRFQKGEQAPQAHYWLGEVYMVQWQNDKNNMALLEKAANEFTSITNEYPNHPKTADALLKLGLIEINKGNQDNAAQYLSEVKSRYPGSAAARIAENRLQQLSAD
jgi:tol-pal system protein YbgF